MKRGEVWWAELPEPTTSEPGFRRPVLILQAYQFNRSHINTVVVAAITSNMKLATAPGNVSLSRRSANLGRESVVNISQIITLDKSFLRERVGKLQDPKLREVEEGVRLVLAL
ncbi:MAG: type II toxin-antitoxin system PemK/MazF family toxin [Halieaceae bacterium]|jgi:mRNA interferase MazF|nr:type II toxin-antitoxin system PemK/MazF family toxin [Halieaceae bacterium]